MTWRAFPRCPIQPKGEIATMSTAIDRIIDDVIKAEGGYSNDPNDAGGETMYGITVAVARANGYAGPMQNLPRSMAVKIYTDRYVNVPKFDQVVQINARVGAELIDTGVNMGPSVAATLLQRWLNGFNAPGSGYQDLFVDGRLGVLSLEALRRFLRQRGNDGEMVLLRGLNGSQAARYLELTESRQKNRAFLFGWVLNRVVL